MSVSSPGRKQLGRSRKREEKAEGGGGRWINSLWGKDS